MANFLRFVGAAMLLACLSFSTYAQTGSVYFNVADAALSDSAKALIAKETALMAAHSRIVVSGYTDADGAVDYNQQLSLQRANAVVNYLVALGVPKNSIEIKSFGESQPLGDNATLRGKQLNRRADFAFYYDSIAIKPIIKTVSLSERFPPKNEVKTINPKMANDVYVGEKGTVLHIPAYAFVDKKGYLVKGNVDITYTEYKHAADMVFSNIPMTYFNGDEEMRFNSAGMFAINGTANGEEIFIRDNKTIEVDYALAMQQNEIAFYALGDNNRWTKAEDIPKMRIDTLAWGLLGDSLVLLDSTRKRSDYGIRLRRFNGERVDDEDLIFWDPKTSSQLLPGADPGHTYPDIVRGLSVGEFGVYNCDQIYRLENKVNIKPVFVDQEGHPIRDGHVLSLIDLKYNGAFSFDPSGNIQLDARGRNVLLLFTESNKIYLISEQDMAKQNLLPDQANNFVMRDVSTELDSTEKLSTYLGLED